jgi:hypothetical protein
MTDPVRDPPEPPAASDDAHDALVKQFDTEVAPRLDAFRCAAAADPQRALRRLYEAGEEAMVQTPPVRRILRRVAAGVIECQLMARLPHLHGLWSDASVALAQPELCRTMTGVGRQEIERASEMLGDAVCRACAEAAEAIGPEFGPETWAYVLPGVLVPQEFGRGDNVIDLGAVRLGRLYQG